MKKSLQEISDFIWVNQPVCRTWDKDEFEHWVIFHYSHGYYAAVLDVDSSIAGVVFIRPCMVEDAHDEMCHDQEGNCIHISHVCCTAAGALSALGFAIRKQFGTRDYVSWNKQPSNKLKIHKTETLRRNLFRITEANHAIKS